MARFKITNLRSFTALAPEPVSRKLPPYGSVEHDGPAYLMDNAQMKSAVQSGILQVTALGDSSSTTDSIETTTSSGGGEIRRGGLGIDYTKISTVETKYLPPSTDAWSDVLSLFTYNVSPGEVVNLNVSVTSLSAFVETPLQPPLGPTSQKQSAFSKSYVIRAFRPVDENLPAVALSISDTVLLDPADGVFSLSHSVVNWSCSIMGGISLDPNSDNLLTLPPGVTIVAVAGNLISQGDKVTLTTSVQDVVEFVFDKNASVIDTPSVRSVAITNGSTAVQVGVALINAVNDWGVEFYGPSNVVAGSIDGDNLAIIGVFDTTSPVPNEIGLTATSATLTTTDIPAGPIHPGLLAGSVFVVEVNGISVKHTTTEERTDLENYEGFFLY